MKKNYFFAKLTCLIVIKFILWGLLSCAVASSGVETLVQFDPALAQNPESIVFDRKGNAYISMAFSGEIRRVRPDLTHDSLMRMPLGEKCGERQPVALGLAIDWHDRLYVAVTACDPANHGIWQVDPFKGTKYLITKMPFDSVINGIDIHNGYIFVADTFKGLIWRVPVKGGEPVIWLDHQLLKRPRDSNPKYPGPNGLRFYEREWTPEIYVAVSATGNIIAVPIMRDGSAGKPRIHVALPKGMGGDEFTFDALGRMYVTTDPHNTLLRVDRNGSCKILLTAKDGLDGPTSVVFGRTSDDYMQLYITNGAFPFFTKTHKPSLMRLRVDIPGATGPMR